MNFTVVLRNFPEISNFFHRYKKLQRFEIPNIIEKVLAPQKFPSSIAMLTAIADGLSADCCWLRADPISVQVDLIHIYLLGNKHLQLHADEIQTYRSLLNSYLHDRQLELVTPHPRRWYLALSQLPDIQTYDPAIIIGCSIGDYLLKGKEQVRWLQLFNELQMLLYTSPVNKQRAENGLPGVDALWFWGEELIPEHLCAEFIKIFSNSPVAKGLAKVTGKVCENIPMDFNQIINQCDQHGDYLIYIDFFELQTEQNAEELLEEWFMTLRSGLRKRRISCIDFYSEDEYVYRDCARTRWWKKD